MADEPSDALAHIFAEMATKNSLSTMELKMDGRFEQVDARFEQVDARFEQVNARFEHLEEKFEARFKWLEAKVDQKLEALKADLTWRMTGLIIVLATVMTLIDLFID